MQANRTIRSIVLILLLASFMGGVIHLFILRFDTGDVYPPYSSLRSDPLGARALYESLQNFDDMAVVRNYQLLHSLEFEPETTFLYLGLSPPEYNSIPEELVKVFDRLAQSGGRLVLSFVPNQKEIEKESKKACGQEMIDKNAWGIGFEFNEELTGDNKSYLPLAATSARQGLPAAISWHTDLYFDVLDDAWRVIYTCQGRPVIVERSFGKGSIVMSADSFFISNEAMRSERHPRLLLWLAGSHSNVIFDETHFGIYKSPGVAGLLRHYRFHGFIAVLLLLGILFFWKNAVYFVPPAKDDGVDFTGVVLEKDYTQGLIALLRRNIGAGRILEVCVEEWEQTFEKDRSFQAETFKRVKDSLLPESSSPREKIDPVKGYLNISSVINEDKTYE